MPFDFKPMVGTALLMAGGSLALTACFSETMTDVDLTGTVRIPVELVGEMADIGIVYIGLFAGWDVDTLGYPYPKMGPVVGDQRLGDTYPYGGTSVGTFGYACYQSLKCQVVTGRHVDLTDLVCRFQLLAEGESGCSCSQSEDGSWSIDDGSGCLDPDTFWDDCSHYYGYQDPSQLNFVGEDQLDFQEVEEDGQAYYQASFRMWHVVPYQNAVLYGFVDNDLTSCNPEDGQTNRRQSIDGGPYFREGTNFSDVMNFPDKYLSPGDLVTSAPHALTADDLARRTPGDPTVTERDEIGGLTLTMDYLR